MNNFDYNKYKFLTKAKTSLALEDVIEFRQKEIEELKEELLIYRILIKDLTFSNPSYIVRNKILNIAYYIIEEEELFDYINKTKKFPLNRLLKRTPLEKEFLLEWKEYIITYFIILSNPKYGYLQEYLQVVEAIDILGSEEIRESNEKEDHVGVILYKGLINSVILTYKGEFIKIKNKKEYLLGEEVVGKESFRVMKYKLQISILFSIIALISAIFIWQYRGVEKTVVVETTSPISIEINKFNKIINVDTNTEKGIELLDSINIKSLNIDKAVVSILNYAINNEMIPSTDIVITVTGKALSYDELKESEEFIIENNLEVKLNNAGNEQKISTKR